MKKYEINDRFKSTLKDIAINKKLSHVHPGFISSHLGIGVIESLSLVNRAVEDGALTLKFQVKCLNCEENLDLVNTYNVLLGETKYCRCGELTKVTLANIYPTYYFTEDYIKLAIEEV